MTSTGVDYVIRSVVTAVIALSLVGAVIGSVLLGKDLESAAGTVLISAASVVIGYYFGNHAAINGKMLAEIMPTPKVVTLPVIIPEDSAPTTPVDTVGPYA